MRIKANEPSVGFELPNEVPIPDAVKSDVISEAPKETQPKNRFETSKLIVWVCLINGFLWVWCSYALAWSGREQIVESLSQVALTEIIGVVLVHCIKAVIENLSKNNKWPDKSDNNTSSEGLG